MKGIDELLKGIGLSDDDGDGDDSEERNGIGISLGAIDASKLPPSARRAILRYIKRNGIEGSSEEKEMKEIKRVKLKPEWKVITDEISRLQDEVISLSEKAIAEIEPKKAKMDSNKALFWGLVERELGEYERKMRYSADDDEIIIYDEVKDDPEDDE